MQFVKKNHYYIFLCLYLLVVLSLIMNTVLFSFNEIIIGCIFLLNILWIYKWKNKESFGKKFYIIYSFLALLSVLLIKPVWESDYARYFIDGLHSAKNMPVYKTIPSESIHAQDFSQAWKESQYNEYGSIYPGLSVLVFKLAVSLSGENYKIFIYIFKLFALIIGLTIALLISKSKHGIYDSKTVILSLFHPLFILEWYINLHFDFLFAFVILILVHSKKQSIKVIVLALGFHIKYLIFLFLPFSSIDFKKTKNYFIFMICLLISALFYHSGSDFLAMIKNTLVFGLDWEMNAGSFRLTRIILGKFILKMDIIKLSIVIQALFIIIFFVIHNKIEKINKSNYWRIIFLFIITSPVVNPWYLTWVLPLILTSHKSTIYSYIITLPIYLSYSFYFLKHFQFVFYVEHLLFYLILFMILKQSYKKTKS